MAGLAVGAWLRAGAGHGCAVRPLGARRRRRRCLPLAVAAAAACTAAARLFVVRCGTSAPAARAVPRPAVPAGTRQPTPAERAYGALAAEYPEAVARGSYIGLALDEPAVTERFQGLETLLGPEAALDIAEKDVRVLLFEKDYVARAWELLKAKEKPSGCTALSVVKKNPGLLTCEAYGLGGEDLESLDRTATVIDSLRAVGLGPSYFFVVVTIGFVFILVTLRFAGKALSPVLDPVLDALQSIPKPLSVLSGLLGSGSPGA